MVDDQTYTSLLDPTKTLRTPRTHRAPTTNYIRPIALLILLVVSSPFLVSNVLPESTTHSPLSVPVTAQTYAPLTFPTPPYAEPSEARTDSTGERASRNTATAERKVVSKVEIVISFAMAQVGKRYSFGTKGPNTYDCSGLVLAAFARIGMSLYHYTGKMMTYGKPVTRSNLLRGDLVFPSSGHVGIYLGSGKFLHASSGRGKVVIDSSFTYLTARRLL